MKKRLKKKLEKRNKLAVAISTPVAIELPNSIKLLAIECWRIKKLLPEFSDNKKHLVLGSSVDKMLDALSQSGIELDDPEGQEFRDGMTLDVALIEEKPDMAVDARIVTETLSPTVYVRNKLVQPARVIVSVGRRGE